MKKIKVVVADDSRVMLQALVRYLNRDFDVIASVQNGVHLINRAMQLHPDVIVSDVSMPVVSGPQALEALTARGQRIPFVFVTADVGLLKAGAWSVVDKTDIPLELDAAVRAAASGKLYKSRRALLQKSHGRTLPQKPNS